MWLLGLTKNIEQPCSPRMRASMSFCLSGRMESIRQAFMRFWKRLGLDFLHIMNGGVARDALFAFFNRRLNGCIC